MSNPSLLCVPYRFKTSKLYSQIPDSGLGDFTVTRSASNSATRVNAAGLIETVADNVPRLDYPLGGITAGCPALLVEPSAQNICLQSEAIGVTSWNNTAITVSPNVSATLDPASGNTAEKIVATAVSGNHFTSRAGSTQTGQHTFSVFAKAAEYSYIRLQDVNAGKYNVWFDLLSGTANGTGASIQNYGNGWYRCSVTYDGAGATVTNALVGVPTSGGIISYTGNGTSGIYVWGAQLETGSVATSYIPTTTAAITRGAEVVSKTGISSLIGQTEGTIYIECQSEFATNDIIVINTAGQSPGNNYVSITKTATNVFRLSLVASGTTILIDQTSAITSFAKIAVAYASGNTALFINGTQIGSTDTTSFSFNAALNNITFISNMVSGTKTTRIRALALYTTRLTNAQLQSLTQ